MVDYEKRINLVPNLSTEETKEKIPKSQNKIIHNYMKPLKKYSLNSNSDFQNENQKSKIKGFIVNKSCSLPKKRLPLTNLIIINKNKKI